MKIRSLAAVAVCFFVLASISLWSAQELKVDVSPQGASIDLNKVTEITITFSRPMKAVGEVQQKGAPSFFTITPALPGSFHWAGDRTLVFTPDKTHLPYSTAFEIVIRKDTRSVDGSVLPADRKFTFHTATAAVIGTTPYRGNTLQRNQAIQVTFNQAMNLAEVQARVKLVATPVSFQIPERYSTRCEAAKQKIDRLNNIQKGRQGQKTAISIHAVFDKNESVLKISPQQPLPLNAQVDLFLPAGLRGKEGNIGTPADQTVTFHSPKSFLYAGIDCFTCDPYSSPTIAFSNEVLPAKVLAALTLIDQTTGKPVPRTEYDVSDYAETTFDLSTYFHLRAAHKYTLTISAELADTQGLTLGTVVSESFELEDYPPYMGQINRLGIIEAVGPHVLAVRVVNHERVYKEVRPVADEEIPMYLQASNTNEYRLVNERSPQVALKINRNVSYNYLFKLDPYLPKGYGILYSEIVPVDPGTKKPPVEGESSHKGVLQVTDIGLSLKYSPHNSLVFTSSLAKGVPLGDCTIKYINAEGKVVWQGKSNADGICRGPGLDTLHIKNKYDSHDLIVLARKGEDRAFVTEEWTEGIEAWSFNYDTDWESSSRRPMGFLFSDRGAYRPGEEVYIKGFFRIDENDRLVIPSAGEVEFRVIDSRNTELLKKKYKPNAVGGISFSFKIPADGATGYYRIVADVPENWGGRASGEEDEDTWRSERESIGHSILVAEYRKPDFRVDVTCEKKDYYPNDIFKGAVNGAYLYGAPMKERDVKWTMRQTSTYFEPPLVGPFVGKYYYFYDWTSENGWNSGGTADIGNGEGKLDAKGQLAVKQSLEGPSQPQNCSLEGEVTDSTSQAISNRVYFRLHPARFYLGIEGGANYFVDKGQMFRTTLAALDVSGNAVKNRPIKLEVIQRQWHSVQEKEEGSYYRYRSEAVDTVMKKAELTSGAAPVPFEYKPEAAGYYIVRATSADEQGNKMVSATSFYCLGGEFTAWERFDHNRMDLIPEKQKYNPGETARILVKSPWQEAQGIVTVERTGIIDSFPITLKGSSQTVTIPIKKEYISSIYVSVLLIKGRTADKLVEEVDVGKPTFRLGYTRLNVTSDSVYLKPEINTDKTEYQPRDNVEIKLQVKGSDGAGRKAEVTLYAVDYGVLSLTGYQLPDPVGYFYSQRALGVRNAESRNVLISREYLKGKLAEEGGGGGADALYNMRKDFRVTPFWQAELQTDEKGMAKASFQLPDSLTTFVVMAVAQTPDSRFGASRREIQVSKPLMLFPTLPRFLVLEDQALGAVRVQNNGKKAGQLVVRAVSAGPGILVGEKEQKVQLPAQGSVVVRFPLKGVALGKTTLRFFASFTMDGKEEKDAVEAQVPVQLPRIRIDDATFGSTDARESIPLQIPADVYADAGGLRLSLSSSALAELEKGGDFLLSYPYGCTEQLSSTLMPFIALKNMVTAFNLRGPGEGEITRVAAETLQKIYKNQRENGGFGLWSDSREAFPYLSAYVLYILQKCEERGIAVDAAVKKKLMTYLGNVLRDKSKDKYAWYTIERVFALYALAQAGTVDDGALSTLYEKRNGLPLFVRAWLLSVAARSNRQPVIRDNLLREILNAGRETAAHLHFEEGRFNGAEVMMHSDLRSNAIVFISLLDTNVPIEKLQKIAAYILSKRVRGCWRNTQENAYGLLALSEFFRRREEKDTNFQFKGTVGKKKLAEITFKGFRRESVEVPMTELLKAGQTKFSAELEKSGSGRLYYGLTLSYVPKTELYKDLRNGFSIERTYESIKGGGPLTSFKLGDLIRVRLKIKVSAERNYVALVDPIPAGTEIENSFLQTTGQAAKDQAWRNPWQFYHQEPYDNRMQVFADVLPQGEYEYSYVVRATSSGTFRVGPVKIEEMYNPETFGLGHEETIRIE